jgi:hypothetical protein
MRHIAPLLAVTVAFGQNAPSLAPVTEKQAHQAIGSMRVQGRVGGGLDLRVTATDRSYNYKLRATWITSKAAVAAARILELSKGLTQAEAKEVVRQTAEPDSWLILVELDPREGSGVIPKDWSARFGPAGRETAQVTGRRIGREGAWGTLVSAFPRDYSYDVFLLAFPRTAEGAPVLRPSDAEAELAVRIYNKQGSVRWKIPADLFDPGSGLH